ncbi:MAG: LysM peptidoglycan-binding domain-containing protein [Planctomycetaceae bacterium]|nr:LysM peptidoglycan-binding domain-containing protein [Planctomycetaceae bacterium]
MKIRKIAKIFVITIVACLALFGTYKLLKPLPVLDIPVDDISYLRDKYGINITGNGQASENGTSSLFENIPLNIVENTQSQLPPSHFGSTQPTRLEVAPAFGNNDNVNSNSTADSEAPPFNALSESTFQHHTSPFSNGNEYNSAPIWNAEQENDSNSTPQSNLSPPLPATLSNPPLTALVPKKESEFIAPSYPYGSQQNAPPIAVPNAIVQPIPTNDTSPTKTLYNQPITPTIPTIPIPTIAPIPAANSAPVTIPTATSNSNSNSIPTPFQLQPTTNLPTQTPVFPFEITETPNSTLQNSPVSTYSPTSHSSNLSSSPFNSPQPHNNQTLIQPVPIAPAAPQFVHTGLRDENKTNNNESKNIESIESINTANSNSNSNTSSNLFTPTSTTTESIIPSNDPNYYSSAVPFTVSFPQTTSSQTTSPQKQINTYNSDSDNVTIKTASQQSEFSSDVTSLPNQNQNQNQSLNQNQADDNRSVGVNLIKPLPLVIEPKIKFINQDNYTADTNNRYLRTQNKVTSETVASSSENVKSSTVSNDMLNLWGDYLAKTKQNNEAVLKPTQNATGDLAPRVAFVNEIPSINNFSPSYNSISSNIFPDNNTGAFVPKTDNSDNGIFLVNSKVESSSHASGSLTNQVRADELSNNNSSVGESGVVATSGHELIDNHVFIGLNKTNNPANSANSIGNQFNRNQNNADHVNENVRNYEKGENDEKKFNVTSVSDSTELSAIPFVSPPVVPHPVLVAADSAGNILAGNKSDNNLSNQNIRELVVRFVNEQLREYGTKEHSKMHIAFVQLSKFYDQSDLSGGERDYLASALDRIALELIYSSKYHVLEPAYVVKSGDTIESIAQKFSISPVLLSKINGLKLPENLVINSELKVVHGQFDAKINTARGELTLLLGGVYAGRFPVAIGRNILTVRGEFIVQSKLISRTTKILKLNNGIMLNGLGRQITPESLGVSQENIEELFDILTESSVIIME